MDRFQPETFKGTPRHFRCEEEMIEWEANNQPEPVEAGVLSSCCGAELKYETVSFGIDPETGYHDDGERCVCLRCGEETEPEILPVRKSVSRQQGELFQEVA